MESNVRTAPGPDGMTTVWLGQRRIAFVWQLTYGGEAGPLWTANMIPLPNTFHTKADAVTAVATWGRANPEHVMT